MLDKINHWLPGSFVRDVLKVRCNYNADWTDARGKKHTDELRVYACFTCATGITHGKMYTTWHGPDRDVRCVHMPRPWFYRIHLWFHGYGERACVKDFLNGKTDGYPMGGPPKIRVDLSDRV